MESLSRVKDLEIRNDDIDETGRKMFVGTWVFDRRQKLMNGAVDNAILEALEMMSFDPFRQIAKMTIIPPTIAFHRFTKLLHFVLK
jgi:hypothetical protein